MSGDDYQPGPRRSLAEAWLMPDSARAENTLPEVCGSKKHSIHTISMTTPSIKMPEAEIKVRARDYMIDGVRYQRVSAVLGIIAKPALVGWMKKTTTTAIRSAMLHEDTKAGLVDLIMAEGETNEDLYNGWVARLIDSAGRAGDEHRNEAADRGTRIHEEIQAALGGVEPEGKEAKQALAYLAHRGFTVEASELTVWDPGVKVAGTIDLVARDHYRQLTILDWKTGKGPWPEMAAQLGAYAGILRAHGHEVQRAIVVMLKPNGWEEHVVNDLAGARGVYELALWLQRDLKGVGWVSTTNPNPPNPTLSTMVIDGDPQRLADMKAAVKELELALEQG